MGFVGCSSGAGRLSGNLAPTWLGWLRLGRARFRVPCLGLGGTSPGGGVRQAWAGLPGNPARWAAARPPGQRCAWGAEHGLG